MYKIQVLDNEEFDRLGPEITRGSDISQSLGFADKATGNAYVRYTGVPDLEKYLVNHELEELQADESTHEDENGIRHKGPKNDGGGRRHVQVRVQRPMQQFQPAPSAMSANPQPGAGGAGGGAQGAAGGLTTGLGGQGIVGQDLAQRVRGFFSGRTNF
jgi:hypothetical protein